VNVGDRVQVVGDGVHCGDRHKGLIGDVWFIDARHEEYGILVDFSDSIGKQAGAWYFPDALRVIPETKEQRIDLSMFEINQLYAAVIAVDKIIQGRFILIAMGFGSETELDVGAIFEALQRELPLRTAMIDATSTSGGE